MIDFPDISSLSPQQYLFPDGRTINAFFSPTTDLVKLDLLFEAGSFYQPQLLVSSSTHKLFTTATLKRDSGKVSEFFDYYGVEVEHSPDLFVNTITVYSLRKYLPEVLSLLAEMMYEPLFGEEDLMVFKEKRKHEIATHERKTSVIARRLFYESLFGPEHPLGCHASVADVDKLTPELLKTYHSKYYRPENLDIVVAGNVDDKLAADINDCFFKNVGCTDSERMFFSQVPLSKGGRKEQTMESAVQTTLRIGRLLPYNWYDKEYARFMVLTTLLGGYFGSRLVRNLREDKGYTYGIHARTQIYRGCIVFYIVADVAQGMADAAEEEVMKELRLLSEQPASQEELTMVKTVLTGDFIRSIDGVFERSSRFCEMFSTHVTEQLTTNLREAINETTAEQIQDLARRLLNHDDLWVCRAGA